MASISSPFRFFSPELAQNLRFQAKPKTPFLSSKPFFFFSSSITFQRLSNPKPTSLTQPIKSQHRQQEEEPRQAAAAVVEPSLLPPNLRDIISLFQSVSDPKAKYHQLLHYGSKMPPLDPRYKTDEHRVRGCVSQVWVRAFPDPGDPAAVRFEADSDSALTKGLAALLVLGLSGAPAPVIAGVPPDFVHLLGLRQSLTPSRNNGFLNMLKLMQKKAIQLYAQEGNPTIDGVSEGKDSILDGAGDAVRDSSVEYEVSKLRELNLGVNGNKAGSKPAAINGASEPVEHNLDAVDETPLSSGGGAGGRGERIRERLEKELHPVELEVEDISYLHAGHAGVRGSSGGETHFNLRVVSREFEGKSMVKRHRLIYDLLQEELQSGLHAISIVAKTPAEVNPK